MCNKLPRDRSREANKYCLRNFEKAGHRSQYKLPLFRRALNSDKPLAIKYTKLNT